MKLNMVRCERIMKCVMVANNREPQECIEEKCYFWNKENKKCKYQIK